MWTILEVDRIFGANTYLKPRCHKGRAYLFLTPDARKYKRSLLNSLKSLQPEYPEGRKGLYLVFGIHRPKDLSNMVKLTEDAIAEYFGLNDVEWDWMLILKKKTKHPKEWVAFSFSGSDFGEDKLEVDWDEFLPEADRS